MLLKHFAGGLMVIVNAMQTGWLVPAIKRLAMQRAAGRVNGASISTRLVKLETTLL